MEDIDKNLEYALHIIHNPQLKETEEFYKWIQKKPNRELFSDLMAYKEALMREKAERKHRVRTRIYIGAATLTAAAVLLLVFLSPLFITSNRMEEPTRFFAAIASEGHITLRTDGLGDRILEDSVMNLKKEGMPVSDTVRHQTLTIPRGKSFQLILPDGTKVWLNSESSLRYPTAFNDGERRVALKGEAYFEVAKDTKHPFIVSAADVDTEVLGTKFNVRSYKAEELHVTLVQGKVQVTNTNSHRSAILHPGQDLTYGENGEERISTVKNMASYTAWTEGMFYFEDAPLEEIMSSLGRWYNVNIDFEQAESRSIKLNFWADRNARPEEAVTLLNKLGKVHIDYQDETITIKQI